MHINNIFYHLMVKLTLKQWSQYMITYSGLTQYRFSCGHKDWNTIIHTTSHKAIIHETHLWINTGSHMLKQHYQGFACATKAVTLTLNSSIRKEPNTSDSLPRHRANTRSNNPEQVKCCKHLSLDIRIVMEPNCNNVQLTLNT